MNPLASTLTNATTCPSTLWEILERWKQGAVSGSVLYEAAMLSGLDLLHEYRYRILPTPPDGLVEYRKADPTMFDNEDKAKIHRKYQRFLEEESGIKQLNASNLLFLLELLAWANERQMTDAKARIAHMIQTHQAALETYQKTGQVVKL